MQSPDVRRGGGAQNPAVAANVLRERSCAALTGLSTVLILLGYAENTSALSAATSLAVTMGGLFAAALVADLVTHSAVLPERSLDGGVTLGNSGTPLIRKVPSMKAVRFERYGDPDVLKTVEVEEPHPKTGQVRIAVKAAGVNPIDWKVRSGLMAAQVPLSLPSGVGAEAAGVVDEVGTGVSDVAVGDHVFGIGSATYAEYAVLDSWARKPADLDWLAAGGGPVAVETAIRSLDRLGLSAGQTLLISGASGGVGSATIQIARARGINVMGTASAPNQDYVRSLGATPTTYGPDLVPRVRALAPNGVDAALLLAGNGIVPDLIELTGEPSRVLSLSDYSAAQYGALLAEPPTDPAGALAEAAALITAGTLRIPVQQSFTLDTAAEAHEVSQTGHAAGRLVIAVD